MTSTDPTHALPSGRGKPKSQSAKKPSKAKPKKKQPVARKGRSKRSK